MSADPDRDATVVALLHRIGLDAAGAAELLERDGARAALDAALGTHESLFADDAAPLVARGRGELVDWRSRGLHVLTVVGEDYPEQLRTIHDRPAILFVAGDPGTLSSPRSLAVVGTRRPSTQGRIAASELASELVGAGYVVVSGLAAGIDAAAHRAAIGAGGRTVAVIGTGHDHTFPAEHAALQAELAADHAVVSPFWPDTPPHADRFRRRNGVMSGLTLGTIIVEASHRSGTRVQARLALAHGRPVFLRRTLLEQDWARQLALRPGVHVIDGAADALAVVAHLDAGGPLTGPVGVPDA